MQDDTNKETTVIASSSSSQREESPIERNLAPIKQTPHLNIHSLAILDKHDGKGRGVYTTQSMQRGTLIEISPVLILSKEEYNRDGGVGDSILAEYVFTWSKATGEMAAALGLGSMFNHSKYPNVTYERDFHTQTIRYSLAKDVSPETELCIYYGAHVRFDDDSQTTAEDAIQSFEALAVSLDGLLVDEAEIAAAVATPPVEHGLVLFSDLPYTKITREISTSELPLETMKAWAIDCAARSALQVFDELKTYRRKHNLPSNFAPHLKHIRRREADTVSLLIGLSTPTVDHKLHNYLSNIDGVINVPFEVDVPTRPAVNRSQIETFGAVWPVSYSPMRIGVDAVLAPKGWSQTRLDWVNTMMARISEFARIAKEQGDLPIASLVAGDYLGPPLMEAADSRHTTDNFLCHSATNVITKVAALDAVDARKVAGQPAPYLLSGLHFFTTHEPCVMCSMALLHSRVAAVYFIHKSPHSGGLGSLYAVHEDKGLNHKFEVWQGFESSLTEAEIGADA